MENLSKKRSFLQRLIGRCATECPADSSCWTYINGAVVVDLDLAPELNANGRAIRIEGRALPIRLLLVRAAQDKYVALENRCTHKGRRIDPLAGEDLVQCCSLGKSTFDLAGRRIEGSANDDIAIYPAELLDNRLKITLFDAKFPGEAF